mmetsp:Transcript_2687/g.5230  ORF Transcript_2687/g.5230 Transcript_2687/m.5230 type:complete len:552 (-) Transcript_2687:197-1852(-)
MGRRGSVFAAVPRATAAAGKAKAGGVHVNNNKRKRKITTEHHRKVKLRIKIPSSIPASHIITPLLPEGQKNQDQEEQQQQVFHLAAHYHIVKLLGAGAFGKVYQATRLQDNDQVALKVVPKYLTTHQALEREVQALRVLSDPGHDHVCRLLDYHEDDSNYYLVMEHIDGGEELFEHLVRLPGPFSEHDAAKFLRQFAEGLAYMHAKGYAHADLKPENLMMSSHVKDDDNDDDPHVKLVDFGFSVPASTGREGDTTHELVFGTVAYLAPEILKNFGRPQQPTKAADMFAVGAIMYTMLTGSHPFDRTNSASDQDIQRAVVASLVEGDGGNPNEYLDQHVFDDRTNGLSTSAISLMKNLLQPKPTNRMTAEQLLDHPWILGQTASPHVLLHTESRLRRFWQRRFRAAILQKYQDGILSSQEKMHTIYNSMDLNGDGHISFEELKVSLKDMFGVEQMRDIFQSMDIKENGVIDYDEFETIMKTQFEYDSTTTTDTTTTSASNTTDPTGSDVPSAPRPVAAAVSVGTTTSVATSRTSATSCDSSKHVKDCILHTI